MSGSVQQIEETAARWLLRREESNWSEADEAALDAWLDAATDHRMAYYRLEFGWRKGDRLAALGSIPAPVRRSGWDQRLARPIALAASLLLLLIVVPVLLVSPSWLAAQYATDVGEHQ